MPEQKSSRYNDAAHSRAFWKVRTFDTWKQRVRQLKAETYALYLAYRDPRVPWYARLWAAIVVGYAFCPIDLIPDFVPVLGYMDDLLLVPLGIWLALKWIPPDVMAEARVQAQEVIDQDKPMNRKAAVVVVLIWLLLVALAILLGIQAVKR